MEERKSLLRIQFLAHRLFTESKEGRELVQLLKHEHFISPIFPIDPQMIQAHGGVAGWCGFREGQMEFLRKLAQFGRQHLERIEAENKGVKV